jgi:hypothetical protein
VLSVQLGRMEHGAVVLIIRRSWVRAPPAPPAVLISVVGEPWTGLYTNVGGAIYRIVGQAYKTDRAALIELGKLLAMAQAGWQPCSNVTVAQLIDQ